MSTVGQHEYINRESVNTDRLYDNISKMQKDYNAQSRQISIQKQEINKLKEQNVILKKALLHSIDHINFTEDTVQGVFSKYALFIKNGTAITAEELLKAMTEALTSLSSVNNKHTSKVKEALKDLQDKLVD